MNTKTDAVFRELTEDELLFVGAGCFFDELDPEPPQPAGPVVVLPPEEKPQ